jgi:hypothetical protein
LPEKLCLWIDPHEVSYRIGRWKYYYHSCIKTSYMWNFLKVLELIKPLSKAFSLCRNSKVYFENFLWTFWKTTLRTWSYQMTACWLLPSWCTTPFVCFDNNGGHIFSEVFK